MQINSMKNKHKKKMAMGRRHYLNNGTVRSKSETAGGTHSGTHKAAGGTPSGTTQKGLLPKSNSPFHVFCAMLSL